MLGHEKIRARENWSVVSISNAWHCFRTVKLTLFALNSKNITRNGTRVYFLAFKQQLGTVSLAITRNLSHLSNEFRTEGRGGDFSVLFPKHFQSWAAIWLFVQWRKSVCMTKRAKRDAGLAETHDIQIWLSRLSLSLTACTMIRQISWIFTT